MLNEHVGRSGFSKGRDMSRASRRLLNPLYNQTWQEKRRTAQRMMNVLKRRTCMNESRSRISKAGTNAMTTSKLWKCES